MRKMKRGVMVRIKDGYCGSGYLFPIVKVCKVPGTEPQVYGPNYGPVPMSELEVA